MNYKEYEMFDRRVVRKLATGDWVSFDWTQLCDVADGKVAAGSAEKRFSEETGRIEYRRL